MIAASVVRAVAATLPAGVRDRYREEWTADAAGASELGVSRIGVVVGALGVAVRLDREDPVVSGIPAGRLAARRLRVALAAAAIGLLLLLAYFWVWAGDTGGDGPMAITGTVLLGIAWGAGLVAAIALVGVVRASIRATAGRPSARGIRIALLVGVPGLFVVLLAASSVTLFGAVLVLPLLIAPLVLVALKDPRAQGAPLRAGSRVGIALASAGAILAVVVGGLLHIFVWNPLARMPGMTLDEIYAGLAAARELPSPVIPVAWAGFWTLFALTLLVLAAVPPRAIRRFLTARRLAGAGLLGVALAAGGVWIAGFGMGMGMADAFMTSGGDAAGSGLVLMVIAIGYAIAAVLVGLLPTRIRPVTVDEQQAA